MAIFIRGQKPVFERLGGTVPIVAVGLLVLLFAMAALTQSPSSLLAMSRIQVYNATAAATVSTGQVPDSGAAACPPADCPPAAECPPQRPAECPPPPECPAAAECNCEGQQGESPAAESAAADAGSSGGGGGGEPRGMAHLASWQSNPHVATTDYQPGLSAREMQKGLVSYGAWARARRAMAKLLAGEPITVGIIGGSITWGHGADPGKTDWAARVFQWVNATFPGAKHRFVNGAIPAAPSSYFSMCYAWHVPEDADLVFLEFNVNDERATGDAPIRRAHERLIRKLLNFKNRPALVEMVFYRYPERDFKSDTTAIYRYHGDDEIGVLAQYYHLPWIGTRSLVWDYLPETAQDPATRTDKMRQMWGWSDEEKAMDLDHPWVVGHGWLADLAIYWMQQVLDDVARHPLEPADDDEAAAELSVPMFEKNYEARSNTCLMGESFKELVKSQEGFEWINEGTDKKQKWGYISKTPGSWAEIVLNTNVAKGLAPGDNVTLAIGHLQSYEHMGQFEVTCTQGCVCDPLKQDGHNEERASQLHHSMMLVPAVDECRLRVTVLSETQSGEHKVKLIGLTISEAAGYLSDESKDLGVMIQYEQRPDGRMAAAYGDETEPGDPEYA